MGIGSQVNGVYIDTNSHSSPVMGRGRLFDRLQRKGKRAARPLEFPVAAHNYVFSDSSAVAATLQPSATVIYLQGI